MHEEIYCCNVSLPHVDTTCRLVCTDLYLSNYLFCATWLSCEAIFLELKEKENVFLFFLDIVFVFVIGGGPPPEKKWSQNLFVLKAHCHPWCKAVICFCFEILLL